MSLLRVKYWGKFLVFRIFLRNGRSYIAIKTDIDFDINLSSCWVYFVSNIEASFWCLESFWDMEEIIDISFDINLGSCWWIYWNSFLAFFWGIQTVSYTHLRAHETPEHLVCRLLLEKKDKRVSHKNRHGTECFYFVCQMSRRNCFLALNN